MNSSKPLGHSDESGFVFAQEMLAGDYTAAINFDRIQKSIEGYIIFEYLLCEESQVVTPFSSHPNRYINKNLMKFVSLWEISKELKAKLYLVNYAKLGTKHADEIRLLRVINMERNALQTINYRFQRKSFSEWFRALNRACIDNSEEPQIEMYGVREV